MWLVASLLLVGVAVYAVYNHRPLQPEDETGWNRLKVVEVL